MRATDKRLPKARKTLRPPGKPVSQTADPSANVSTSESVELRLGLPRSKDLEPTPTASHPRESGRILVTALYGVNIKIAENKVISGTNQEIGPLRN